MNTVPIPMDAALSGTKKKLLSDKQVVVNAKFLQDVEDYLKKDGVVYMIAGANMDNTKILIRISDGAIPEVCP